MVEVTAAACINDKEAEELCVCLGRGFDKHAKDMMSE